MDNRGRIIGDRFKDECEIEHENDFSISSSLQAPHYHSTDPSHPTSFPLYLNTNM